jgi:stage III sporulation protein AC
MHVELIWRIAGIGILVSVLATVLKKTGHEDMAMLTTLAGLVVALLMVVNLISELFQSVRSIFNL